MPESRHLSKKVSAARRRADIMGAIRDILDQAGRLRYGVPTSEKERLARAGALPGAPEPDEDAEEADRYASGYLFSAAHPTLSRVVQPLVSRLKVSDLPAFGGSSAELQSFADAGAAMARRGKGDSI